MTPGRPTDLQGTLTVLGILVLVGILTIEGAWPWCRERLVRAYCRWRYGSSDHL